MFGAAGLKARVLTRADVPALQRFFEANPEYFLAVQGVPPRPDEAAQEFDERPPPHLPYAQQWTIGFDDEAGALAGSAVVLSDFIAPGVWHIGLFILATARHGTGQAMALHAALEGWMRSEGAQWVRLGAVVGNTRAERFWPKAGYIEVRRRQGIDTGARRNDLRVFAKPLTGGAISQYLERVPRDRPDSEMP